MNQLWWPADQGTQWFWPTTSPDKHIITAVLGWIYHTIHKEIRSFYLARDQQTTKLAAPKKQIQLWTLASPEDQNPF